MESKKYTFKSDDGRELSCQLYKGMVILYVAKQYWIGAKGYSLYKYNVCEDKWLYFASIKDCKYFFFSKFFLTRRLFRAEIKGLYRLKDDNWMCIAKKGIFKLDKKKKKFVKCFSIKKGSMPLNLCQGDNGSIYFGDYFFNPDMNPINIYSSHDEGNTWQIIYTFPKGKINHIHGIFQDPVVSRRLWVATGDMDSASILGYTDDNFQTFVESFSGNQQYRLCVPLFKGELIYYPTDSQYEQNYIRKLNLKTGMIDNLVKIEGSGIYATQTNDWMAVSTTIEPSYVNLDKNSYLWLSKNGDSWFKLIHFEKDALSKTYFQFGSIRFPKYDFEASEFLIFNGRALRNFDGCTLVIKAKDVF